ncbi:MAG: N-acetylmuramoyl-L-alanine amidase [Proteobacteria bacterium]|nr:N-acetylmuramoyl-L-alanine amidase [Pseudomonadota bacterium]
MANVDYKGAIWRPSPNHEARTAPISFVILHGTWMADDEAALNRLSDASAKVSCHYMICADGRIIQLVREEQTAWHAGISAWGSIERLNPHSIGIEISNPGPASGVAYSDTQYAVLEALLTDILARNHLTPAQVLGHSDIAPDRKDDPGAHFDWARLEALNLAAPWRPYPTIDDPLAALRHHGYRGADKDILAAFQLRHLPTHVSGTLCPLTRARILGHERA